MQPQQLTTEQVQRLADTLATHATGHTVEQARERFRVSGDPALNPEGYTALAAVMIDIAPELTLRRAEAIRASVHATERDARTHTLAQALSLISRGQDLRTLGEREGADVARAYVADAEDIIDRNPHLLSLPERERLNLI